MSVNLNSGISDLCRLELSFYVALSVNQYSCNTIVFICSENYIFGKFDTFCKRLEKIADMINTMNLWSGIADVRIEGIDSIIVRYKTVCDAVKKKTYDILDHRKGDFDTDYIEFKGQFENLRQQMQNFLDTWFERNLPVRTMLISYCIISLFSSVDTESHY